LASTASRKQRLFERLHEAAPGLSPPPALQPEAGGRLPGVADLFAFAGSLPPEDRRRRYPCLARFAKEIGLSEDVLIANYEIENIFHDLIGAEPSADERRRLNHEVYTKVFQLYGAKFEIDASASAGPKDYIVRLLAPLLANKSILDVGCGAGHFLLGVSRLLEHGELLGIDVFAESLEFPARNLSFERADIVRFDLDGRFDVAMSDNVYEHIASSDIDGHLRSIHRALKPGGLAIIFTPHRAFGPFDVTRIVDDSYCGWTPARGTHLDETTYAALAQRLNRAGFDDLQVIPPRVRGGFRAAPLLQPLARYLKLETVPTLMRRLQALDKSGRLTAFEICIVATKG
jgi:SAM-dependent methyltransferase